MSRTFISQNSQVFASENYNDNFTSGSALQSTAKTLEDDLNALRTQVKKIMFANAAGNWYDTNASRGLSQINADIDNLNSEFALLSSSLVATQGDVTSLQGEVTTLQGEYSTVSGSIVTINGEIDAINNALTTLSGSAHRTRYNAGITTNVNANTNVSFPTNLDGPLGNYSNADFTNKVNVYLNGVLLLPGVDENNSNDVYPGTSATTGDLKFPYHVRSGSQIAMEIFSALL